MVVTIFTILLAVLGLGPPETHAFIAALPTASRVPYTYLGRRRAGAAASHRGIASAAAIGPLAATCTATQEETYIFRDKFKIHAETSGPKSGQPVLLVHGFGCSTTYWRAAISTLVDAGYRVHVIDLLGQGKSEKPGRAEGVEYSINLWATLVDDYARDVMAKERRNGPGTGTGTGGGEGIILIGNSLGSLVALSAALGDHVDNDDDSPPAAAAYLPGRVKGLCFYNIGVGLNSRGIVTEPQWAPFQRYLFTAVLNILDLVLFKNPPVLKYLLNKVVTKDLLRGALEGLYRYDPTRVDDELIDSFYYPAQEKGAPEALGQIYTNDPGRSPMDLHEKYSDKADSLVIHLVWGDDDAVTPLAGGVGAFYLALADDATTSVTMDVVGKTGHIPFDDNPIECNGSMLRWIETL